MVNRFHILKKGLFNLTEIISNSTFTLVFYLLSVSNSVKAVMSGLPGALNLLRKQKVFGVYMPGKRKKRWVVKIKFVFGKNIGTKNSLQSRPFMVYKKKILAIFIFNTTR